MNDEVHAAAGLAQFCRIRDAVFHELNFCFYLRQVFRRSSGQIIEHDHIVTSAYQFIHSIGTNEPGPPSYQIPH